MNGARPKTLCLSRWISIGALAGTLIVVGAALLLRKPAPQALRLPDGTEAFFLSDSKVTPTAGFPKTREIHVDGDIFFRTADLPQPLVLRSRLLVLTVSGPTALRITAYAKEAGEQVEVLSGNVVARKSYPSDYSEPDVLTGGEMTMINRDIDLMEKEKCDVAALRAWSETLVASAKRYNSGPL